MRDPEERLLQLPEDAVGCVRCNRRGGRRPQAASQLLVADVAADRIAERACVTDRHKQPVLPVPYDLRDSARSRREHGRPNCERLDDRVREVLPARRENRRVCRREELEYALARLRTEEANPTPEAKLRDGSLERRLLVSLAGKDERDGVDTRERLECDAKRLLRRNASGERKRRPRHAERAAQLLARRVL